MDPLNILIGIAALALILGLIFGRRRPSTANTEQAPNVEPEKQPEPDHTLLTVTTFSPQWHNENGWPALCVESFPSLGKFEVDEVVLTAEVNATYSAPDKEDLTLSETVEDPQEIAIKSMREVGKKFKTSLEVGPGILVRARKDLPPEYDQTPTMVTVKIRMDLFGRAQ